MARRPPSPHHPRYRHGSKYMIQPLVRAHTRPLSRSFAGSVLPFNPQSPADPSGPGGCATYTHVLSIIATLPRLIAAARSQTAHPARSGGVGKRDWISYTSRVSCIVHRVLNRILNIERPLQQATVRARPPPPASTPSAGLGALPPSARPARFPPSLRRARVRMMRL